jgi:hypothetical protein
MSTEKASASYGLTTDVCTVLVPRWPREPEVVARRDNKNEVTVVVAKANPAEVWNLVQLQPGVLCVICSIPGALPKDGLRIPRTVYDMEIQVLPGRLGKINVLRFEPNAGR